MTEKREHNAAVERGSPLQRLIEDPISQQLRSNAMVLYEKVQSLCSGHHRGHQKNTMHKGFFSAFIDVVDPA